MLSFDTNVIGKPRKFSNIDLSDLKLLFPDRNSNDVIVSDHSSEDHLNTALETEDDSPSVPPSSANLVGREMASATGREITYEDFRAETLIRFRNEGESQWIQGQVYLRAGNPIPRKEKEKRTNTRTGGTYLTSKTAIWNLLMLKSLKLLRLLTKKEKQRWWRQKLTL